MTIPLDKILTCSARDYAESIGKKLSDYEMKRAVKSISYLGDILSIDKNIAPSDTEAITDLKIINTNKEILFYGTALIPKEKLNK